ncbi:MAG TPA: AI-2E family transporter, partial [Gemmatimonadales bacterium]|nr:AI-2E family transporter [Gemmatimonadales bacterium]
RFSDRLAWGAGLFAGAALLLLVWMVRDVLLLGFAGILLGLVFRVPAEWLAARTPLPHGVAVVLVVLALFGVLAGVFTLRGADIRNQANQLRERIPRAAEQLQAKLEQTEIGREVVKNVPTPRELLPDSTGAVQRATGAVTRTFALLANVLIVLFLGIVLALTPRVYTDNVLRLVPVRRRARAEALLGELGHTLRWWLLGRLVSMSAIGVLTWIGLSVLDVPLAFVLALIAALLSFVPNIGPVVAAAPAVLLGLVQGPEKAIMVALLYLAVQAIESWLLDPVIDRKTIYLPPALTVLAQLAMAVIAGLAGVALATPLAAVVAVTTRKLYVEGVLGDRQG